MQLTAGLAMYGRKSSLENVSFPPAEQIKDLSTKEFLLTAHSLDWKYHNNEDKCRTHVNFTFDAYQEMLKRSGRQDLENQIRTCSTIEPGNGHVWIQYYENGEWKNFESTTSTRPLTSNKNQLNFEALSRVVSKIEDYSKIDTEKSPEAVSIPGTKLPLLTQKNLFGKTGILGVITE